MRVFIFIQPQQHVAFSSHLGSLEYVGVEYEHKHTAYNQQPLEHQGDPDVIGAECKAHRTQNKNYDQ